MERKMIVVTGGCSSGKSFYAEKLLSDLENTAALYYIATMEVRDGEDEARVARHRQMRAGRGFITIETPRDVIQALNHIRQHGGGQVSRISGVSGSLPCREKQERDRDEERACALLECITTLTANEMFRQDCKVSVDAVAEKIICETLTLGEALDELVVVTNNVFEDGNTYDEFTMKYLQVLGEINRRLAAEADRVIEVVAGIPVRLK